MVGLMDSIYENRSVQSKLALEEPFGGIISPGWPTGPGPDPITSDLPRRPSEYWRDHCFVSGSFLAPYEVALRHEVGLGNQLWASDYPHAEGTWPHTNVALRHTFGLVPEPEARMILGENALGVYGLNAAKLREVADRIGPKPEDLQVPVQPEEIPLGRSWAFRTLSNFA
jgi:hypothetical protein